MTDTTDRAAVDTVPASESGLFGRLLALIHHKEFQRFWKFAVVGAIGFIIDAGVFNALLALGWLANAAIPLPFNISPIEEVGIAGAISFTLAVSSNFLWNRYWTYPDSRSKPIANQLVTFFLVNIAGLLIRIPILEGLSGPFGRFIEGVVPSLDEATMGANAALVLAVVIVMFWNFFVNRYWTYNDVD